MKILLTGGHAATTALATIEKLKKEKSHEIFWIGAKSSVEGKKIDTLESKVFPSLGVGCFFITSGRLQRKFTRWSIISLLKIPVGFWQSYKILNKVKPEKVLSFGGYIGFPVVMVAWFMGISVVLHEQTIATGLANKLSSVFAKKVALARLDSAPFFPKSKIVHTGNPILESILKVKPKTKLSTNPTLLVICGSRGSQKVNAALDPILERLIKHFKVIHQTGSLDFEHFTKRKEKLDNYEIHEFINPLEVAKYYQKADLFVGRGGANTISEIVNIGLPSLIIPIPWTRFNEQTKNAESAKKAGVVKILKEENLTPDNLYNSILSVKENWNEMVKSKDKYLFDIDRQAADNLVQCVKNS